MYGSFILSRAKKVTIGLQPTTTFEKLPVADAIRRATMKNFIVLMSSYFVSSQMIRMIKRILLWYIYFFEENMRHFCTYYF